MFSSKRATFLMVMALLCGLYCGRAPAQDDGGGAAAAVCGNGTKEGAEECDDGNRTGGDGCDVACKNECGNGTIQGVEECDDGNLISGDKCNSKCEKEDKLSTNSGKLGFATGIGVMFLDEPDVMEAEVKNGTVRIEKEENKKIGLWLETNYMFPLFYSENCELSINMSENKEMINRCRLKPDEDSPIYYGPFVGVQAISTDGDEELFNSVALGGMVSFKKMPFGEAAGGSNALNVGVGYYVTRIDVLGDHVHDNAAALPAGVDSVRTKRVNEQGWMVMVSFQVLDYQ